MQAPRSYSILGLMSGSSLDGLDMALCDFTFSGSSNLENWQIQVAGNVVFSDEWKERLRSLPNASGLELTKANVEFGDYLGMSVLNFVQKNCISPQYIASHGHTIFHFPDDAVTLQIGSGTAIATICQIPVIDQFRLLDMAYGGQGAPLAPIADQLLFAQADLCLNIGGIINISARTRDRYVAFDIGGANQILNALSNVVGLEYDDGGKLAATGKLDQQLFDQAMRSEYFTRPYPKSLGNDWVLNNQVRLFANADSSIPDRLYTACKLIAIQTAKALEKILAHEQIENQPLEVLVTGGGAFNHFLIDNIQRECNKIIDVKMNIPEPEIIAYKEAALMALMGALRIEKQPNCLASVTGASRNVVGGIIHWP